MTPERLKEIRERVDLLQHATLHGPVPLKTTMQLVVDLVEVLELVDELTDEIARTSWQVES